MPLRHGYDDGTVTSRMIPSKSKVAPLPPVTILRLEQLCACFTVNPNYRKCAGVKFERSAVLAGQYGCTLLDYGKRQRLSIIRCQPSQRGADVYRPDADLACFLGGEPR